MTGIERKLLVFCALVVLVCPASVMRGDWNAGDPNKWVQFPDLTENGIDIRVDDSDGIVRTLADDFKCTTTGLITDVHLWGSWKYDDKGEIENIHLSIHNDNPQGVNGYSEPNELLWEGDFGLGEFIERMWHQSDPGEYWWDPATGDLVPQGDTQIWQINIDIDPCEAFEQKGTPDEPIIYWLDVRVTLVPTAVGEFGWKTRKWPAHFNDDAVFDDGDAAAPVWKELKYPLGHPYNPMEMNSIDLAFVITTQEEPPPPGKPLVEHSKWSQPPIEVNSVDPDVVFCGWDEPSFTQEPEGQWKVVADDYRCIGSMPVTSIHWWGSYYGWEGHGPPAQQPTAWRIGFWSNVAAGAVVDYSYPEKLLWQVEIPADRVTIEEIGTDYFPIHPPDTCFQYNVQLDTTEWFRQEEYLRDTQQNVFWISIAAIYPDVAIIDNPWGWKTRPWHWMDDAVTIDVFSDMVPGTVLTPSQIEPLEYEDESYDTAYELNTDPNYIKWEQYYTGIRNWPHYEDEESMATEFAGTPEPNIIRLVADDWPCNEPTPVRAIAWWGSYIGYRYQACSGTVVAPPQKPDYFLLNIWSDVPADPCDPASYSHPGQVIWEYRVYQNDYDEVLVGYDKHPHSPDADPPYRIEPVFRYSVRLPQSAWFRQPTEDAVFWLSVVAVYVGDNPQFPWGWTNHEHMYNDDAVAGYVNPDGTGWTWQELFDQTEASEDMSFILFQEPGCFPSNLPSYFDWLAFGKPDCWCGAAAVDPECKYQCYGDGACDGQILDWRVYSNDMVLLANNWKKKGTDPTLDPCADVAHDGQILDWRVYSNDLVILANNWKAKGSALDLLPACPTQ